MNQSSVSGRVLLVKVVSNDIFSNGKVVWAKNLDIQTVNLKAINVSDEEAIKDGEKVNAQVKELGVSDIFPQVLLDILHVSYLFLYSPSDMLLMGILLLSPLMMNTQSSDHKPLRMLVDKISKKIFMFINIISFRNWF